MKLEKKTKTKILSLTDENENVRKKLIRISVDEQWNPSTTGNHTSPKVGWDYKEYNTQSKRNKYDRMRELIVENYIEDGDSEKYLNYNIDMDIIAKE